MSSEIVAANAHDPDKPIVTIITPGLGMGGAEQWVRCLVTHCKNVNWVVAVLGTNPMHPVIGNGVIAHAMTVHTLRGVSNHSIQHVTTGDLLMAALDKADAVVVWGGGSYWPLPTKAPVIFVGHGSCYWTVKATTEALDGGATHFAGVSTKVTEVVSGIVGADYEVRTITNGVDTSRLIVPDEPRAIRRAWAPLATEYARYVGYVGRLGNEKNIDSVVYAVASLPHYYHLVLVGCTGGEAANILQMARVILRDRLIEVPATDALGLQFGGMDCVVQVSPREGHSLTVCEAMLTRTPIVSTMTGALPELCELAGSMLVEAVPEDPTTNEIALAIREVCHNPPTERLDIAERFAREHLTQDAMCTQWEDYLTEVIGTSQTGRSRILFTEFDRVLVIDHKNIAYGLMGTVKLTDRHGQIWVQVDGLESRKYLSFPPSALELYKQQEPPCLSST